MKKLVFCGALALASLASAAVKFPYPQAHGYDHTSTIATNWDCAGNTASSMLKKQFITYLQKYYEESGDLARIKFDNANETVSEGIGYAMILCVYFSDNTTSYQRHFDKLWNYYKKNMNGNGIMNWKISGFGGAIGTGGATDAEEDVAFALAMAYYQFGDSKYKNDAATLIANMRKSEFSSNGMHKLGDQWDNYKNPSYVSPAAYEIFKEFDAGQSSFWDSAIKVNYELLLKNRNSSTGIPSGWADNSSYQPIVGNNGYNFAGYDYDAVRAPWRWAWSYAWYGHSQAKDLSSKLASWVSKTVTGKLYINMNTDGTANMNGAPCTTNGCKANGSSIGSLSSVLMVDSSYQQRLNENYGALMSQQDGYFHSNLRLLTGLLMSGNMQNFAKATPVTPTEFVVPDSCNAVKELHKNSGEFGWLSTTTVLTNESMTGVHMGALIQNSRDVHRALEGVEAGKTYKLSFVATQTEGTNIYLTYDVYSDSLKTKSYCSEKTKLAALQDIKYECEFTATDNGYVELEISLNNWDEPEVEISALSLSANGVELINEEHQPNALFVVDYKKPAESLQVDMIGDVAFISISGNQEASVVVTDMQGKVVTSGVRVAPGMNQIPLNLRNGKYMLMVKQGKKHWVRGIRVAQ
ncbi:MAG: hypothetical protein IJ912_02905 [Fibrobacter sp.]|nr:hypothetical protein [Fibrobacter sp.]